VRRILEELPESLDGTYERVLKEIRKPNQLHTHRLIQCLVVAARPLRVEELAEVLAIDFDSEVTARLNPDLRWPDQERAVMTACSSLISIVNDGDSRSRVVQFSHFSVKEFLMSHRLAESSQDIIFRLSLHIQSSRKPALGFFSDWTTASIVTASRATR
jgi:hypothetical protein